MEKNVQAEFQMLHSYVKEFNINNNTSITSLNGREINGEVGFRIINIKEEKEYHMGEIELINNIKIIKDDKEESNIHISMVGMFKGSKEIEKKDFEEYLKLNGATSLSHIIRAFIYSVTGLSGIPSVVTPMINFVDFFKKNEEEKSSK